MNIKIFIASLIVAILFAAISFFANLTMLFPAPLAIFAASLVGGCLTCFWVCSADGVNASAVDKPAKPARQKKTKPAATKPVNKGAKETGSVKWFSASKGFGFITRDNGDDIFVHFRSILGNGHRILREGQRVEFAVTEGDKGLQAEEVSAIKG